MGSLLRPELTKKTIKRLKDELEQSKKTIRILKNEAQKEHEKLQARKVAERNLEIRIDALKAELKLTQEFSSEKAANLQVALKQISELKSKLEVVGGKSQTKEKKLDEMKTELRDRKQEIKDLTLCKDALEARLADTESLINTLQRNLNGENNVPVNTVHKQPPTVIPIPRNHPRVALKKFDRADSDRLEIQKSESNNDPNKDLPVMKVPVGDSVVHKLNDSPAFQLFWKKLGINVEDTASRKKKLVPLCGNADWTRRDLERHLDRLYEPSRREKFSPEFMFLLEGLLRWGPEKVNALAFVPRRIIKDDTWTDNDQFSNVDGHTIEVFFVESYAVCYAGTYECYHARDYFPEGVCNPKDISIKSLSRLTVIRNNEDALGSDRQFNAKYRKGELKVDCAILQCVGFNEELYEKLSKPVPGNVLKRRSVRDSLDTAKKMKI